ncbi:TetR/AcrR family transcriptional regulator [Thalassolituus sp. LLYu03]|uniref:TetR/AcrR family transcriptional regulator n=1 Tax=Thalassolituus sp. LLYu03 TaxID=3421656 RepID=UPI003D2DACE4
MAQKDTVKSILNAAEELFSEKGFAETSLRNITTKAGVNLAAVNYHFGSKKALIQAVFARYLTPFCESLGQDLTALEARQTGQAPALPELLMLLSGTALKAGHDSPRRLGIFMRLLGLAYTQGQGHLRRFLQKEYGAVFFRYMKLVTLATPDLSDEDRFWRIHFMLGATVFTLSGADSLTAMAEHDFGKASDIAQVIDKLIPFLASGLNAPHQAV